MWKQHTRRRQRQTAQGRPRRQAEHAAPGSADSALAGCPNGTLPEIGPPTHSCAAQQSGGVARMRERQVRVPVHDSGVSQVPTQLGFKKRGWCGPPLGLQPQYAGQCGVHA
jgi:hypothetical protein